MERRLAAILERCARREACRGAESHARLRLINPAMRLSNLKGLIPIRRPEHFDRLEEGLRKAGLPE
jgi:hypothetical protein